MADNLTPIEQNSQTINEIKTLVEGLPEAGGTVDDNFKVIARLTTTEEATQVTLDKDLEGNDFALREAIISITPVGGTANTERSNLLFWCNGQNTAVQRFTIQAGIFVAGQSTTSNVHITNAEYGYWCEYDATYGNLNSRYNNIKMLSALEQTKFKNGEPNTVKTNGINSITISFPSDKEGYTFGVGTQIIIQGVRM